MHFQNKIMTDNDQKNGINGGKFDAFPSWISVEIFDLLGMYSWRFPA